MTCARFRVLLGAGGLRQSRWLMVAILLVFGLPSFAQFDTGTIKGTVTDPSGAAVPRAKITATHIGTGINTSTTTDANGDFVISALPYGNYVVRANASGFAEAESPSLVLNVGAIVRVNLALAIASAQQRIEVTGTTTTVQTETTQDGTTLNAAQVANLPVNGRDVSQFLSVAPGSINSTGFFQGSVNGLENVFTGLNITVDGQNASRGDINGFLDTEGQEGARVTRSSLDSIQEIDFTNSGYSAEKGYSLGPQMNIITKSGTNNFHGTVFEFLRNDAFDAKDYFNTGKVAPLRLNQFGGNLGGPLIKNKLFFFVNYEGDRTKINNFNALYKIPSAYLRSEAHDPRMDPVFAQFAPLPANCNTIPAPPSCAVPGSETPGDPGGAQLIYTLAILPNQLREDTGSIKVDWNISERDHAFVRYNINDSLTNYTFGLNQGQVSPQKLRTQLGKIEETHTFSPTLLNQFSISINRFYSDTNSNTPTPLVGFSGFFTDLGALPGPNTFNQITPFNVFEVFDNVTKTVNSHTLKFGIQFRYNQLNEFLRPQQTFYFAGANIFQPNPFHDFLNDAPFVLGKIGFPGPAGIVNSNWGFYGQDDWKVTRKLTLSLGLRYDYNTVWKERTHQAANFDFASQTILPQTQALYNAPGKDFAPRVGLSWDPFGNGKTVIHGYGGLFYMPMQFGFGLLSNNAAFQSYNVNVFQVPIAYPMANPPLPAGTQNVNIFPQHPRDPVSTNWLLGVQREVLPNTVLSVNYTGNKAQHMQSGVSFAALNLNPANVVTQARQFSGFANENLNADVLYSTYNALQVQLRRNAGRLNYEVNYTWSHEIDDMVNVFGGFSDPFNPNVDRGSGDWDVRHNLTGSVVYDLPDWKRTGAIGKAFLSGWQVSNILQTRTGLPTNVQLISGFFGLPMRPNYVPGQSPTVGSAKWPIGNYNPAAFAVPPQYDGTWGENLGNVGRNALRGPGFFQWDFSLAKNIPIREALKVQLRADFFNILNHPNFANPDGGICTAVAAADPSTNTPASCTPNTAFGRTGQTIASNMGTQIGTGTSRQIQLAVKVIF
ncbi:MAG TPA: carboxypeptidase regulatory-like domain-containing protein [Terriglobia bacterium]|jgi:hypothetical protein|nr:carboxypeptidase regulatory-like domain-containing protein [Terriglobia bacterium]